MERTMELETFGMISLPGELNTVEHVSSKRIVADLLCRSQANASTRINVPYAIRIAQDLNSNACSRYYITLQ